MNKQIKLGILIGLIVTFCYSLAFKQIDQVIYEGKPCEVWYIEGFGGYVYSIRDVKTFDIYYLKIKTDDGHTHRLKRI